MDEMGLHAHIKRRVGSEGGGGAGKFKFLKFTR